jgi:tetratricopeptide (TPR) repeat protein
MIFRYGRVVGRHPTRQDEYFFEWRPGRDRGPVFRDLSWDFAEPDQYPELVAAEKPGLMASKGEKAFHTAVAGGDPEVILGTASEQPQYRQLASAIAGLLLLESDLDRGIAVLDEAVASGEDIARNRFLHKYMAAAGLTVVIAAGVMVHLPLQRNSIILLLAELHQARGDTASAQRVLEMAEPTTHVRLSQAELAFEAGDHDRVLQLTQGVFNDDDVTALMLAYRGRAFGELGRYDEAVSALARALEYPNRAESVKALALVGRGMIHQAQGEHILAENDFTMALMEVPDDEEAQQHIQELIRGGPGTG